MADKSDGLDLIISPGNRVYVKGNIEYLSAESAQITFSM
jgi:uncharacterized protein (DUF362 family)